MEPWRRDTWLRARGWKQPGAEDSRGAKATRDPTLPPKGSVCLRGAAATSPPVIMKREGAPKLWRAFPYNLRPTGHFIYGHMLLESARLKTISYKRAEPIHEAPTLQNAKRRRRLLSACTLAVAASARLRSPQVFLPPSLPLSPTAR